MNTITSYLIQMALTLGLAFLIVGYLRPYLRRILTDLCGTDERAQFWTAFSNILLIGMPMIFALNFWPNSQNSEDLFFEVAGKLSNNLGGLLFGLVIVGGMISFFALVASKSTKVEAK
jgi:tetrahydromethanopterin S-methyltransferase subunit B